MAIDPIHAPSIQTPRLLLRPLAASDRTEFVRVTIALRGHIARWLPAPPPDQTPEQALDTALTRSAATLADGTGCRLVAILREAPGTAIAGFFNLNNITRGVFLNADAGWSLAPDCTGRGLAAEALTALLDLGFVAPPRGLGLHRVQANIMPDNAPSLTLARRCGFREEGLARRMLCIAGRWQDHVMFAKLADEHAPVYLTV